MGVAGLGFGKLPGVLAYKPAATRVCGCEVWQFLAVLRLEAHSLQGVSFFGVVRGFARFRALGLGVF